MTDFQIADHGSIISIKPVSEAARTWVDENVVSEPWQWLGGALCVDIRCALWRDNLDENGAAIRMRSGGRDASWSRRTRTDASPL